MVRPKTGLLYGREILHYVNTGEITIIVRQKKEKEIQPDTNTRATLLLSPGVHEPQISWVSRSLVFFFSLSVSPQQEQHQFFGAAPSLFYTLNQKDTTIYGQCKGESNKEY